MSDLITTNAVTTPVVPVSRVPITTRVATMADIPFIDGLQKIHTHMVGWMPKAQLEGKIKLGHVIVAEAKDEGGGMKDENGKGDASAPFSSFSPHPSSLSLGYCISQDTYSGRDDVG